MNTDKSTRWTVEVDTSTPLEYYGCVSRKCDTSSWTAWKDEGRMSYELRETRYMPTLSLYKHLPRRINTVKKWWETYAKKHKITNWEYA